MTNRVYLLYLLHWQWLYPRPVHAFPVTSCLYYRPIIRPVRILVFCTLFDQPVNLYPGLSDLVSVSSSDQPIHLYPGLTNIFLCIQVWPIYSPVSCTYTSLPLTDKLLYPTNLSIVNWPTSVSFTSQSVANKANNFFSLTVSCSGQYIHLYPGLIIFFPVYPALQRCTPF